MIEIHYKEEVNKAMKKKVIIIGAGPGGVSAGMLLAHQGVEVHIFEQNDYVGGRNSLIQLGDYRFDMGPTFFLMKDVLEDIFERTGRKLSDYVTLQEIDPMYRLFFSEDKVFYPSRNQEKMKTGMEKTFPGSYNGYLKYLQKEKRKYDQLIPCLAMPYSSVIDLLKWQFLSSIPYLDAHISVVDVLGRYFDDDDLKVSFSFQAKYLGMSPWEAPGLFSILSYIEHGGGIYHITGGLYQLSVAMAKVVEEEGGKIHLSTPVKKLLVKNGKAVGVLLEDGSEELADDIIVNADFAHAMTTLVDRQDRRKYSDERLEKKKFSCSTFMLYLGINHIYQEFPHHNIIFAEDYKKNVEEITHHNMLSRDPSFYVQNASVTDSTLAPEGKSTIYVLVPAPNNNSGIDWEQEKMPFRETILNLMENRGEFHDIRQYIDVEKIITPQDWQEQVSVYKGAVFNLGHQISQMLMFRPHNQFEEFDNCYLVGGGTHPGSGLPTIYQSGIISASLILKKYQMNQGR
jgi:phytoene desaturase